MVNVAINPEFLTKMNDITKSTKEHIERWDNSKDHSNYWAAPTHVDRMIAEFGAENIFMIGESYASHYHDDYCTFTYYNNLTGEIFHDEWATAYAAPAYDAFKCTTLYEAFENNALNLELLLSNSKNRYLSVIKSMFEMNHLMYNFKRRDTTLFDKFNSLGLRVEVKRGRKWKGIGYLINSEVSRYRYACPRWRTNDADWGVSTTIYYKIFDPITNNIETVGSGNVDFIDLEKYVEEYVAILNDKINNATTEDVFVNAGNGFGIKEMYDMMKESALLDYIENKYKNNPDLTDAVDAKEEERRAKRNEFKKAKMEELIEWVKTNTDKEGADVIELASHIFNKRYGDRNY